MNAAVLPLLLFLANGIHSGHNGADGRFHAPACTSRQSARAIPYAYTERNQLLTETFPGATGGTRTYGYYPNGQLKTRLDQRGITTTYIYDPANRLTDRTYSDGTADHFVLDDAGRITSATASRSGVVVARQYFPTGLIKEEQTTWPAGISGTSTTTLVGFTYDSANRETTLTLPDGRTIDRTFTNRNELRSLAIGGQSIATLGYDNGGRRTSTAFANGLTDTRTYTANNLLESTTVAAGAAPAVVALSYSYDLNRRKLAETDARDATRTQNFGYDFNDRLTSWSTGATPRLPAAQTWELSPVGDWNTNTVDGVTETRTHTAVHEIKTSNGLPLGYDAAGNLTRTAEDQRFTWDAENRLLAAEAGPNPDQAYGVAQYSFDALGRRVAKRVFGTTTLFVHAGNWQVVQEIDAPTVASPADKASDGDLASLGIVPDGAILWPTWDVDGNRLDPIRVNMQPESTEIPDGFLADKGRDLDVRTNGLTYGWLAPEGSPTRPEAQVRHFMPMPQYDTLAHLGTAGQEWKIALPNGSYPVVVVCGDATSLAHTNNITINGAVQVDPDPGDDTTVPAYEQGDFDGYAVQVEVTDGFLTITAGEGAFDPTLCFVEIGAEGTELTQDIKDWLADQVDAATKRTGGSPFWNGGREETRSYVWGSGIDELVGYQRTTVAAGTSTFYIHNDSRWSVMAVSDAGGQVVERRQYTAYGKQVLDNADSNGRSIVGLSTSYTGRSLDEESGLMYYRNRMYAPRTGVFVSRDPKGYVDGPSLYRGYFTPNTVDPTGLQIWSKAPLETYLVGKVGAVTKLTPELPCTFGYSLPPGGLYSNGKSLEEEILKAMLSETYPFRVDGDDEVTATENLKRHVATRMLLIQRALSSKITFGVVGMGTHSDTLIPDPKVDQEGFWNAVNQATTVFDCNRVFTIMYVASGAIAQGGTRPVSTYIPGDLMWMNNANYKPPTKYTDADGKEREIYTWGRGNIGQNILYVGGQKWWGLDARDGATDTLEEWKKDVDGWKSLDGSVAGKGVMGKDARYPFNGLFRPVK